MPGKESKLLYGMNYFILEEYIDYVNVKNLWRMKNIDLQNQFSTQLGILCATLCLDEVD